MARTRSVEIQESLHELDQLRQYYRNTPQAQRLLFLYFLKENPKRTITEAAEKAELSVRRGERLWESYRRGGVGGVLHRRVADCYSMREGGNKSDEDITAVPNNLDAGASVALANALSMALLSYSMKEFVSQVRKCLLDILPGLRYVVVNIRLHDVNRVKLLDSMLLNDAILPNGAGQVQVSEYQEDLPVYQRVIQDGQRIGVSFDQYSKPIGFDFFFGPRVGSSLNDGDNDVDGQYVACLVMFFDKNIKFDLRLVRSFIERSRPFISCVFHCSVLQYLSETMQRTPLVRASTYGLYNPALTARERQILSLKLLGNTTATISSQLCIAKRTVDSHLKSIYKKAGVRSYPELVSRHYAAL